MKISSSLVLMTVLLGTVGAPSSRAQATADFQAKFGLKLVLSGTSRPGERYIKNGQAIESISKSFSVTMTTRDILFTLIDDGEIVGPLAGWSIVARANSDDAFSGEYRLFAVKKGQPDHPLDSEAIDALDLTPAFEVLSYKHIYYGGNSFTGSGIRRFNAFGTFSVNGHSMFLSGNVSLPYSFKTVTLDEGTASLAVPGTTSFKCQGGMAFEIDEDTTNLLIEGSMTFSAHKPVTIYAP